MKTKLKAVFPFSFIEEFYEFLARNSDIIEVITYDDFEWADDDSYETNYIQERVKWCESFASGKRDPNKIYVLIQHDVDNFPDATHDTIKAQMRLGLRSNVMIHNKFVDRPNLAKRGIVSFKPYPLDKSLLRDAQKKGFVIGYHHNALEQANFDEAEAANIFVQDLAELRAWCDIDYFSPHGGVRGPSGYSNAGYKVPLEILGDIKWVHNGHTVRFDKTYSDGGFSGSKIPLENRDPRDFISEHMKSGGRYRFLFHPQYYHDPYSIPNKLMETSWYKNIISSYKKENQGGSHWPDSLLDNARNSKTIQTKELQKNIFKLAKNAKLNNPQSPAKGERMSEKTISKRINPQNSFSSQECPIIIGGDGRSGTTLVSIILNSHPELFVGGELHFSSKVFPNLGNYILDVLSNFETYSPKDVQWRKSDKWKPGVQFVARADRLGVTKEALRQSILDTQKLLGTEIDSFDKRCALVQNMATSMCKIHNKDRWGFKIMREIRNPQKYAKVWPRASFVNIIRDGRDVACSQTIGHGTWGYKDLEKAANGWVNLIRDTRLNSKDLRYIEILYEDIVQSPKKTLKKLTKFLDVPWNKILLNHEKAKHDLIESKVAHPSKSQIAKPINNSALGRYKKEMTTEQITTFNNIAGEMLLDLGYEYKK